MPESNCKKIVSLGGGVYTQVTFTDTGSNGFGTSSSSGTVPAIPTWGIVLMGLLMGFRFTRHRIDRWEGGVLLGVLVIYLVLMFGYFA